MTGPLELGSTRGKILSTLNTIENAAVSTLLYALTPMDRNVDKTWGVFHGGFFEGVRATQVLHNTHLNRIVEEKRAK